MWFCLSYLRSELFVSTLTLVSFDRFFGPFGCAHAPLTLAEKALSVRSLALFRSERSIHDICEHGVGGWVCCVPLALGFGAVGCAECP